MGMKFEGGKLVITMKIKKTKLSASGKTLVVASTRGVKKSAVTVEGKPVSFVANAFIANESSRSPADENANRKPVKKT